MTVPTFRDFAAAAMSGRTDDATNLLAQLLAIDFDVARVATTYFQEQAKTVGQPFIVKAMGLRDAIKLEDDTPTRELVATCFGLEGDTLELAVAAVRALYG